MSDVTVQIQELDMFSARTEICNAPVVERLADIGDVDTTNKQNGSVLVYKTNSSRWTATTLLDLQTMEGGEY